MKTICSFLASVRESKTCLIHEWPLYVIWATPKCWHYVPILVDTCTSGIMWGKIFLTLWKYVPVILWTPNYITLEKACFWGPSPLVDVLAKWQTFMWCNMWMSEWTVVDGGKKNILIIRMHMGSLYFEAPCTWEGMDRHFENKLLSHFSFSIFCFDN